MLISSYFQVNQFHVFHMWNFAIYGRHYSGNIKVRMRRKIFQLQRNFIEVFFYRERCYFTRFPFLGYGILAGHPRCWRQTDVPALNSKQKSKQNLYYAHGAEYIANVCWWLWWTGHLFLAMQDWTTRGCHYVQRQWELLKSSVVLHRVPTYGGRWHSGRGMVL